LTPIKCIAISQHNKHTLPTQEQANAGRKEVDALPAQTMEINPSHPLIVALYQLKDNPGSVRGYLIVDSCLLLLVNKCNKMFFLAA